MELESALYKYFSYSAFRGQQKEIISKILEGKDTVALLPTGAGKSICFQLPALLLPGLTLVVTPLIALMQDQVDTLLRKGIYATYISSTLSQDEVNARIQLLKLNKYKLLYISPERLQQKRFTKLCRKLTISLIVIDEAHCISEWGHDFRPPYLSIHRFISSIASVGKRPTIAAFTATATTKTLVDIQKSLQLVKPVFFRQSFFRSNLHIRIFKTESRQIQEIMLYFLLEKHSNEAGIIYVSTRKAAEYLSELLQENLHGKIKVGCYHGDLKPQQRQYIQKLFMSNHLDVVVATSAFGMGVDKSNISFVIHYHYPSSLEAYYQEIGRGGRGGEAAYCYLLFNSKNERIHLGLAEQITSAEDKKNKRAKLKKMQNYALSTNCRMITILQYFNEESQDLCQNCDSCELTLIPESAAKNTLFSRLFCTVEQHTRIKNLDSQRKNLKKKLQLSSVAEVLTDAQLLMLAALQPQTPEALRELPGFGLGWQQQWLTHFLPGSDKIIV